MSIVVLLGNPRSGTSLLRLVLNAHPQLVAPPECGFVQWNHSQFSQAVLSTQTGKADFVSAVCASRKFETWGLGPAELLPAVEALDQPSYQELCAEVYREYGRSKGKEDVKALIDKNNYYVRIPEDVGRALPEACYIHLVRDGRDVACSYLELKGQDFDSPYAPRLASDVRAVAEEWSTNIRRVEEFLATLPAERSLQLRYEDLVLNFEVTARAACEFLGVTYNERMSRYYEFNDEPAETLDWKLKTLAPLDSSSIGRYATDLGEEQRRKFESVAGSELARYGYLS